MKKTSCQTLLVRFAQDKLRLRSAMQTPLSRVHPPLGVRLSSTCATAFRAALSIHCFLHLLCSSCSFSTVKDLSTGGRDSCTVTVVSCRGTGMVRSTRDQPSSLSVMILFDWTGLRFRRDECGMVDSMRLVVSSSGHFCYVLLMYCCARLV